MTSVSPAMAACCDQRSHSSASSTSCSIQMGSVGIMLINSKSPIGLGARSCATGQEHRGHINAENKGLRGYKLNAPCAKAPCDWKRSEEHTSELQSRGHLVCRLLLEKKN